MNDDDLLWEDRTINLRDLYDFTNAMNLCYHQQLENIQNIKTEHPEEVDKKIWEHASNLSFLMLLRTSPEDLKRLAEYYRKEFA